MATKLAVTCPACKARFQLSTKGRIPAKVRLRCSSCCTIFVLRHRPAAAAARPEARSATPGGQDRVLVLVAHESEDALQVIRGVLQSQSDFEVVEARSGREAWSKLFELRPNVLVSDVALPELYGFEVADRIHSEPSIAGTKIVLMASVYDKTAYKRSPTSLYGADDYIEKHHIPDSLVPKINRLMFGVSDEAQESANANEVLSQPAQAESIETPRVDAQQEAALKAAESAAESAGQDEDAEYARRLARIIVADIALYNEELISEGLVGGNLEQLLGREIDEARRLFAERVPAAVRERQDFLGEEIERLLAAKRAEHASAGGAG